MPTVYKLFPGGERIRRFRDMGSNRPKNIHGVYPDISKEMHIAFIDDAGRVRAGVSFGEEDLHDLKLVLDFGFVFDLGLIPEADVASGNDAIHVCAYERARFLVGWEYVRREERNRRIEGLHREFLTACNGVRIRGIVTKGEDQGPRANFLNVSLVEPFLVEGRMYISPQCFADAVVGHHTFDDDGFLTDRGVSDIEGVLSVLYERELERQALPPANPALRGLPQFEFADPLPRGWIPKQS